MSPEDRPRLVALIAALTADTMLWGALTFVAIGQHDVSLSLSALACMLGVSVWQAVRPGRVASGLAALTTVALAFGLRRPDSLVAWLELVVWAHAAVASVWLLASSRGGARESARWSARLAWHQATALGVIVGGGLRAG